MVGYRVFDKTERKFRNIVVKDEIEKLTSMAGREFQAFVNDGMSLHVLRIIEGPCKVIEDHNG